MFRICYFVLVLVIITISQVVNGERQKLLVTVYYESECSDSRHFIEQQLNPTIKLLSSYIQLELVPFGKANSIDEGKNGFVCQHGPTECTGNMVQTCALSLMQDRSDVEKVEYVNCEMETRAGTMRNMACVLDARLPADEVEKCFTSSKGTELQLEDEYLTNQVKPTFIPTITINGIFNQQIQDAAFKDLASTLCSILEDAPPCINFFNRISSNYAYF